MGAERGGNSSGELIQIVILTLFITSAFLGVASLVFGLMIPGRRGAAEAQARDLDGLVKTLKDREVRKVRDSFEQFRREIGGQSIRDVIRLSLGGLQNNVENFPSTGVRNLGNTTAYSQKLKIKDAKLQPIFDFLARVRQRHRGVHAANINLTRSRARMSSDSSEFWNVDLTFYLYQNKEIEKLYKNDAAKRDDPEAATVPVDDDGNPIPGAAP